MSNKFIEKELAYEWIGASKVLTELKAVAGWGWGKTDNHYILIDSIYDTKDEALDKENVGVRVRSKSGKTTLTAKKFLKRGPSGEAIFEEQSVDIKDQTHPMIIKPVELGIKLPANVLYKKLSFQNERTEVHFRKGDMLISIINENVTYSDKNGAFREPLLEIEFENVPDGIIEKVRVEIEAIGTLRQIHEGKTDRAKRFLAKNSTLHIENTQDIQPIVMPAHGGRGNIQMRFFHTAFSRFDEADDAKAVDYKRGNWEFFAHAILPVGSEVKEHLHDRTDEIYFILAGSATFTVDGRSRIIKKGDCILTRKESKHSLTDVTEDLEFIATEIL